VSLRPCVLNLGKSSGQRQAAGAAGIPNAGKPPSDPANGGAKPDNAKPAKPETGKPAKPAKPAAEKDHDQDKRDKEASADRWLQVVCTVRTRCPRRA
jgi:hypothetical protein